MKLKKQKITKEIESCQQIIWDINTASAEDYNLYAQMYEYGDVYGIAGVSQDEDDSSKFESGKLLFLEFLNTKIDSWKKSLECPVCFETAETPIYQCNEAHLICNGCKDKVDVCPTCRVAYTTPHRRHRYAEKDEQELKQMEEQ